MEAFIFGLIGAFIVLFLLTEQDTFTTGRRKCITNQRRRKKNFQQ